MRQKVYEWHGHLSASFCLVVSIALISGHAAILAASNIISAQTLLLTALINAGAVFLHPPDVRQSAHRDSLAALQAG
ncbi:hypothetical protein V1525DRAFT_411371 [Lipomyces kononenkoae]|uniref:Uncharacterized protein n=1 Tax=Lipomyces kononenkoae TaxID=34357 RepID=A0ACC3STK3_LIPKO